MGIFNRKCLSDEKIKGFENYKYSCIDSSPIAVYISHPFWNWFVNFYPKWLAPNVLTLTGAAMVMACFFFVAILDYDLDANSFNSPPEKNLPVWVWLVCSTFTFSAHLLDGTDGKQARRTGASGPTGELFDHGLDSWSTVPFTITIFSLFGTGTFSISPLRLLCTLISVQLVFIVTHWEKYNTGILFLSWGYDASQYGLSIFYMVAYLFGHRTFQFYVFSGFSFAHLLEASFYLCCISSFIMSFYNLYQSYFVHKTGKQVYFKLIASNNLCRTSPFFAKNLYEFILPMVAPTILFSTSILWAVYSPNKINDASPRLFCWTMGVVFSHIAVKLIIDQMSVTRARPFNEMLLVYCGVALAAISGAFGASELLILKLLAIALTCAHIHFGICLVRQLCDHFKINAFSLKYLEKRQK